MKNPKTDDLIALICKAATEKYREDRVRPGIQIAHIPAEPSAKLLDFAKAGGLGPEHCPETTAFWYVALHRYPNPRDGARMHTDVNGRVLSPACPEVRKVVHKAKHEDLDRAIQLLGLQLLPLDAQIDLAVELKGVRRT